MRAPFSLFFVGWWLVGQSWMATGQYYYPKPSFSVSPEVVTLGENVTVRCFNAAGRGAEFFLYRRYSPHVLYSVAKGTVAEFVIVARISDEAVYDEVVYFCRYCLTYHSQKIYSPYSEEVLINIADPKIPKPSIKMKLGHQNALGSSVTIECQGPEVGLHFLLYKASTGNISRKTEATYTATAYFNFPHVGREDAGSYTCLYRRTSFVWSAPSDPVELNVTDPELSSPSIEVRPKGQHEVGMEVTIECKGGPENDPTFSLHKSKNLTTLQTMQAEGNTAKFLLSSLSPEDAGNYTCRYYLGENPFVSSKPSDPVEVVVVRGTSQQASMSIIWANAAAGLLLALFALALILVLYKRRRKRSTLKEENQPVNRILEQNDDMSQDDRPDHDGVTYAVLNQHALKTEQPAVSQHASPESCLYASVAKVP